MKLRFLNLVLFLALFCPVGVYAQLIINEIMQGNIDCLIIEKEYPDSWVELYNPTDEVIDIQGYGLSLTKENPYIFNVYKSVPAKGHIIICCDKDGTKLHTDFRLDAGSGDVYLFDAEGNIVDHVSHKKQLAPNIAYGRENDGSSTWGHMLTATPGASNTGGTTKSLLPEPIFSQTGGLFKDGFTLEITIPTGKSIPEDVGLAVTLNGSEPTADNIVEGSSYTLNVNKTKVVRAKLVSSSAHSPRATTHSYIFHPEDTKLSVISITTDRKNFYDSSFGIMMGELGQNPNWEHDWRRPINIEYFDTEQDHKCTINQNCETRIQGAWTRRYPQKSLAVYAQKRFGTKRFNTTNFFKDKPNVTEAKSFILRNGGNDFEDGRIRDQLAQSLIGRNVPGTDWQAYRPAICYINGEYKGIYDIRERSNEDNIYENYNGLEDIDMVENWCEVKAGDIDYWKDLVFPANDITSIDELKEWTDIEGFLNMYALQTFAGNTDFVDNNIVCWRPRQGDQKWRWLLKDLDRLAISWQPVNHDYFSYIRDFKKGGQPSWDYKVSYVFNLVLDKAQGKRLLADRLAIAMGDYLQKDYMEEVKTEMYEELHPEYYRHMKVYFKDIDSWRYNHWKNSINYISSWWKERTEYVYTNLIPSYLGMPSSTYQLQVDRKGHKVKMNDIEIYRPQFNGRYYSRKPIELSCQDPGCTWRIVITHGNNSKEEIVTEESNYTLTTQNSDKKVYAEIIEPAGVSNVLVDHPDGSFTANGPARVYNLQGICVKTLNHDDEIDQLPQGIYIIQGQKVMVR